MKAILETVTGISVNREIDTSDSPLVIMQKFYTEDPTAAFQSFFSNEKAVEQLMDGQVEEERSAFELISVEGDPLRANWKEPLCSQAIIKEGLSQLEAEGQIPTFVVSVNSIVAAV